MMASHLPAAAATAGGWQIVPSTPAVQRWRDWETVLEPLSACRELSVVSTDWPGSFRLRLAGCS